MKFFYFSLLLSLLFIQSVISITVSPSPGDITSALSNLNSGDVLQLSNGVYTVSAATSWTTAGLRTITGSGTSVIQPAGAFQGHFALLSTANVNLQVSSVSFKLFKDSVFSWNAPSVTLSLSHAAFLQNSAPDGPVVSLQPLSGGKLTVDTCQFTGNSATAGPGGVLSSPAEIAADLTVLVANSNFDGNSAVLDGGCFLFASPMIHPSVSGSVFRRNSGLSGGAIVSNADFTQVQGCQFYENAAKNAGGAIRVSVPLTVLDSVFGGNSAVNGGGIRMDNAELVIRRSQFYNSTGTESGALLTVSGDLVISDSSFHDSSAPAGGCVLTEGNTLIERTEFYGCQAQSGAALLFRIFSDAPCEVRDCLFRDNTADVGTILVEFQSTNVSFYNITVRDNTATKGAGLAVDSGSAVKIYGSLFEKNQAITAGGGLSVSGSSTALLYSHPASAQGPLFRLNHAQLGGGIAVSLNSSIEDVASSASVAENTADRGAGVYIDATSSELCSHFHDGAIVANAALLAGGGVFYDTTTFAPDCAFYQCPDPHSACNNTAVYGPLIASPPASVAWDASQPPPDLLRSAQVFDMGGVLLDIFGQAVTGSSRLYRVYTAISDPDFVLNGKSQLLPRDSDALVQFSDLSIVTLQPNILPRTIALTVSTQPASFQQTYNARIQKCVSPYVNVDVEGTNACFFQAETDDWVKYLFGALAIAMIVCDFIVVGVLIFRAEYAVHRPTFNPRALIFLAVFGSVIICISILTWAELSDSLCEARVWLGVLGIAIMLTALLPMAIIPYTLKNKDTSSQDHPVPVSTYLIWTGLSALITLLPALIILIIWNAQDAFHQIFTIDYTKRVITTYCTCDDDVYIWVLIGFGLFSGSLLVILNGISRFELPFNYRESKHFFFALAAALGIAILSIIIAASFWDDLNIFAIFVLLGLIVIASLPIFGIMVIRFHRAVFPLRGQRLNDKIEWMKSENVHRTGHISAQTSHYAQTTQSGKGTQSGKSHSGKGSGSGTPR